MRILVITQQSSGVGYHRLMLPVHFMPGVYGLFTDVYTEELHEQKFDILFVNRFVPGIDLETIKQHREKYGFKLVVDIDDYWILDPWHILAKNYPTQNILDHIRAADLVTCTHERLLAELQEFNKNTHVLPNALPFGEDQFLNVKNESEKVRFIYTGSITHQKDVEILRFPLKRVLTLKDKVEFCLCGYNPEETKYKEVWHNMIQSFTCGFQLGFTRAALPVDKYMNFYNDADVSLVPLVASKFNSMKSNLKVLEAASREIPVIASNVPPYDNCPIIPINSQTDWFKEIKKVTLDSIYRQEKGKELSEWATLNFSLRKINEKRKQLFDASIKM